MLGSTCYLDYTGQIAATEGLYNLFAFFLQRGSTAANGLINGHLVIVENGSDGALQGR
jgi:hypothetical protein